MFVHIKISYCWFNRPELLEKAKDRYHNCGGKKRAAEYHIDNKDALKTNPNNKYRKPSEEKKEVKRKNGRNRYINLKEKQAKKVLKK